MYENNVPIGEFIQNSANILPSLIKEHISLGNLTFRHSLCAPKRWRVGARRNMDT